ncbi:MAG: mechanosensitive ion channel family protein [Myxococcota bacterium]
MRTFLTFSVLILLVRSVEAYETGCKTPQSAAYTLFHYLEAANYDLEKAASCFEATGASEPIGELARKLKATLDAKDLFVDLDRLSTDPNFADERGESVQLLEPRLPEVRLVKKGNGWLVPAASVAQISELYDSAVLVDIEAVTGTLPDWARKPYLGVEAYKYLALLMIFFAAVLVRFLVGAIVVSQIKRTMERFGVSWGNMLLGQVAKPLGILAGAGAAAVLVPSLVLPIQFGRVVMLAIQVVAVFSVVWTLYRLVDLFSEWMDQRAAKTETKLDDQLVPLVRKALKIFIVAMGSIFILQNLNVDVAGLLAGLGIGGLAFALAAKDTVANVFGSATIFADRPFQVGDWINAQGIHGTVETVGFRSTKVRTFYDSLVSIPNAKLADSVIDNYGARTLRRVYTRLGVTYDTPPEHLQAFVEGIRAIIQANAATAKNRYEVHFNEYGASSLEIMVYFFLEAPSWSVELRERHNIFLEIFRLADDLGVNFAFPTQTLHVESTPDKALSMHRAPATELAAYVMSYGPDGERSQPTAPQLTDGFFPK